MFLSRALSAVTYCLLAVAALSGCPAAPALPPVPVTGASLDERTVRRVIVVDPATRQQSSTRAATLRDGLTLARGDLMAGIPVKVLVRPGIYREDLSDLEWDIGRAHNTLLVLEGVPGQTVWSGADIFPRSTWRKMTDGLLVHDWPYRFGNYAPFWGPKKLIAHRTEMAFFKGQSLRPEVLETYKIRGQDDLFTGSALTYVYTGLRRPEQALTPGTFGVTELAAGGGRVYLRLPAGVPLGPEGIELSVRRRLINFGAKHNLVVRGMDFVHCANRQPGETAEGPVTFTGSGDNGPRNILIDHCRFLWNSGPGLCIGGNDWTVRRSVFNGNGFSGIAGSGGRNIVFEYDETSYNCWRAWRGGEADWASAGVKMHETDGQRVIGHLGLANCEKGFWWDVYCSHVTIQDSVLLASATSDLEWELGMGLFYGKRLVLAGSKRQAAYACTNVGDSLLEDSILYFNSTLATSGNEQGRVASLLSYPRDDLHGKRHAIRRGIYRLNHCLIVGGPKTPWLVRSEWWGADPSLHFRAQGSGNVYFSPHGPAGAFRCHLAPSDLQTADYAAYARAAHDADGRFLDPRLRDPDNYDFRLAANSPLKSNAAQYPSYVLPAAKRKQMQAFFRWLRCPPGGPGEPPADEP